MKNNTANTANTAKTAKATKATNPVKPIKLTKKLISAVSTGIVEFSEQNWRENITALFTVQGTIQDNIQKAIAFGVEHYKVNNSNNPEVFNFLMQQCQKTYGKGLRSECMKDYIKALVQGYAFRPINGEPSKGHFVKASKSTKLRLNEKVLEKPWYEFNKKGSTVYDVDLIANIKRAAKTYIDAGSSEKAKQVNTEENSKLLPELSQLLAKHGIDLGIDLPEIK